MKRNFIAKRFQSAGTGLTLDTAALAKYKDIVDLSIGATPKRATPITATPRATLSSFPRSARRGKRTSTRAFRATTCS